MADLSLDSPTSFRLVAAAAATVGSLALVALGVQIGTDGLGTDDPGRNRAATAASRSAAVVDLSRTRPVVALDDTLLSLVPVAPSGPSAGTPAVSPGAPAPAPGPAPGPAPTPAPDPAPAPPVAPGPTPDLPPAPPVGGVPDPAPLLAPLAPVLDPVVDAVVEPLATLSAPSATTSTNPTPATESSSDAGLLTTLAGLLGL